MLNKHLITGVVIVVILLIIFKMIKPSLKNIVSNFKIREDKHGSGKFGANRISHKHQGIDLLVQDKEKVIAPFNMDFLRHATPYKNDNRYTGGLYKFKDGYIKIFYMTPSSARKEIKKGDIIGYAQNITKKYSPSMLNHIHVETYDNGMNLMNPSNFM